MPQGLIGAAAAEPTANAESFFCGLGAAHLGHSLGAALFALLASTSKMKPHFPHWYSNNGINSPY